MRYLDRWFGAEGGTRTPTSCLTRPSNVRVCQFRHFGYSCQITILTQTVSLQLPSISSGRSITSYRQAMPFATQRATLPAPWWRREMQPVLV